MDDWLLFLGAGASVAPPTSLPLFPDLAAGVLGAMGWRATRTDAERVWIHDRYPAFKDPDLSAEVLFGALQRFGIQFAEELARLFRCSPPGAAHQVAAQVLRAGGCVWTTNVDLGVEHACAQLGIDPPLAGRASDRAPELLVPLRVAAPGTFVKLHGSAAVPISMAFTDRELMSPLPSAELERLAALAEGRIAVFFGYAGADADLAELLDEVMRRAAEVVWHEPFVGPRREVQQAFRHIERVTFRPRLSGDSGADVAANAQAFLDLAEAAGTELESEVRAAVISPYTLPSPPTLELAEPPGIVQARVVERFGAPAVHPEALRAARVDDLLARRSSTLPGHLRWAVTRSLYNAGTAARLVRWLAAHRRVLHAVRPLPLRDHLITRASALRLRDGWEPLGQFAEWSTRVRRGPDGQPYPVDLYYRAQARRYEFRPALAGADADAAARGLETETVSDPERLAGALLESGLAAVYAGRFDDALARGFDLRFRRGRYAIAVWRGWGAWLQAVALCHLGRPENATQALAETQRRFSADGRPGLLDDLRTVRLLTLRVAMAKKSAPDNAGELLAEARAADASGRYRDDLDLILADLAIALYDLTDARRRLNRVVGGSASPTAEAMAQLGLAELERLDGNEHSAARHFDSLAQRCRANGAGWLELQALLGLGLCSDRDLGPRWQSLRGRLPAASLTSSLGAMAVGEPRVLWLLPI
ncbi:MAG TPA: SIR2 family protein [Solirubrobacteraceae bacterium]|jgi:hypothetical protein